MKHISKRLYSDSESDCGYSVYTELSNVMESNESTVSSSDSSPMIFLTAITKEEDEIRENQDQLCRSSTSPPPLSSLVSTTYNNTNGSLIFLLKIVFS
uniref:Uncharacterized protein n=1 Tax=Heterorhabditis bacteriophora TaxID=37862 RepID=A0A1I7WSH1_HETBA